MGNTCHFHLFFFLQCPSQRRSTVLDSFSQHLVLLLCASHHVLNAVGRLYTFFLTIRKYHSSYHPTTGPASRRGVHKLLQADVHHTGTVLLLASTKLEQTLSDNIAQWKKFSTCCAKTETASRLMSSKHIVSSMNAANSITDASPHYIIFGQQPNIGLP